MNLGIPQTEKPVLAEKDFWSDLGFQTAGCEKCKKSFHVRMDSTNQQLCPNCCAANLSPQPSSLCNELPELTIPFQVRLEDIKPSLTQFIGQVWLRPADCESEIMFRRIVPVFIPMYLIDCNIVGDWEAETGFVYQVQSSQETYLHGQWRTHDEIEDRIRWEKRAGQITRHYQNVAVPAIQGHRELLDQVGGVQMEMARPFQSDWITTSTIRVPDEPIEKAWMAAKYALDRLAGEECRQASDAQHLRNFRVNADYPGQNWTQLLIPLYITFYTDDDGKPVPIIINGQSGKISGLRLASQRKGWKFAGILAAVAILLAVFGLGAMLVSPVIPPLGILGIILILFAFFAGLSAIIPAAYPWQWNRRQIPGKISSKS